ncbi:MAG: HNH endonuclease, partial [Bdellovibrionales bacterium]|nr:HNH endonuclease [Bdellovibrionales bacterium]
SSQHQVEREVSLANPRESGRGRMNFVRLENEIAEKVVVHTPSGARVAAESRVGVTAEARKAAGAPVAVAARVQLEVGISEKLMIKIRRAQGLVGQKLRRGATLEETLEAMVEVYLSKHDPNERAKRQLMRGKLGAAPGKNSRAAQKTGRLQFSRTAAEMGASKTGESTARRPLPAATKHRVYLKFQARCGHVDGRGERCQETKFLEIHHLRPLHAGGDDRLENLALLCSGHHQGIHLG